MYVYVGVVVKYIYSTGGSKDCAALKVITFGIVLNEYLCSSVHVQRRRGRAL